MGNMVLAAASYTKAITSLKSVLLTLGSAIGAVMLVYGGIKFALPSVRSTDFKLVIASV